MTTFTRTWNVAYEALPPNTENAKNGAERINQVKVDIRERMAVDHSINGDTDDGAHKKVTFVDPLGAKPTQQNDESYVYAKDVLGTSELFYEDEAGNEIQLTSSGQLGVAGQVIVGALTGNVTGDVSGSSGSCTGNSATATKWSAARTITFTGDATSGAQVYDGSGNVSFSMALAANSVGASELTAGIVQTEMAASSVGAVGTFALLRYVGGTTTAGTNRTGSLSYASANGDISGAAAGTWKCMGYCLSGAAVSETTLWMRVS